MKSSCLLATERHVLPTMSRNLLFDQVVKWAICSVRSIHEKGRPGKQYTMESPLADRGLLGGIFCVGPGLKDSVPCSA